MVIHTVKKFPAPYGILRFITVFTSARHWSLSWDRWIQSTTLHPNPVRSVLILSSYICLGLTSDLFPSSFPAKILHAFLKLLHVLTYSFHSDLNFHLKDSFILWKCNGLLENYSRLSNFARWTRSEMDYQRSFASVLKIHNYVVRQ
jgi:hypothetical protein